jgi:hypothetical protein
LLTLCPYLLKPIANLPTDAVDSEHIIPHAMGGSNQFVLPVDKLTNSTFGRTVDSDLIHDPMPRFIAATQGVQSRTGEITVQLPGIIVETGEDMTVAFGKSGMGEHRIKNHHPKDPTSGKLLGLCGFDDQFEKDLERLTEGSNKKRWETSNYRKIENPCIKVDIPSDPLKVSKGLAKIAYLMACRTFGDTFALSPDAEAYRAAIQAKDWDDFDACGLHLLWGAELPLVLLPDIATHQHLIACFGVGSLIMVTVKLFGGVAVSTFAFPARDSTIRDLDGVVVINDSLDRAITEQRLQDAVPIRDMVQRMISFKQRQDLLST